MSKVQQKNLITNIAENSRKPASEQKSIRQVIKASGYSQTSADHPNRVINTKSWNDLVEELIPKDAIINKVIQNALQTRSIHGSNNALDMALKILSGYAARKIQLTSPSDEMSDEQLDAEIARLENEIKQRDKK